MTQLHDQGGHWTVHVDATDGYGKPFRATAVIDSGSMVNAIDPRLVNKKKLSHRPRERPAKVRSGEGTLYEYNGGMITDEAPLLITVDGDAQDVIFDILPVQGFDMILGRPWLKKYNPVIDWKDDQLNFGGRPCHHQCPECAPGVQGSPEQNAQRGPPKNAESEESVTTWIRFTHAVEGPESLPYDSDDDLDEVAARRGSPKETKTEQRSGTTPHDDSLGDLSKVPKEYLQYSLFRKKIPRLPDHGPYDHEIKLKEGANLKFFKPYHLNPAQAEALREYIEENLKNGFIRESQSPAGYPVLFVPRKGDGKLRMVVDYRSLNDDTIKNRYPLPLIAEMRERIAKAQWFSKLDFPMGFNHIRIKEGDEHKTAFRTRNGHYEYQVMPFGLTNAPATFQSMIDHVLRPFLDRFVFVYLDDVLIYSKSLKEHKRHMHQVLTALEKANLSVNPEKSQFHTQELNYLGFKISPGWLEMEDSKVEAVRDWPTPTSQKGVQAFLGFANFYRCFIRHFAKIAKPLHELTGEGKAFVWTSRQQEAFDELRRAFTTAPVLALPDFSKPFKVETDASEFAMGGVLSQKGDDGKDHPVAFLSKGIHGPALRYPVHDKELMAIIQCFAEWAPYLSGTKEPVDVFSDHNNLRYFLTKKLSPRQARWAESMAPFHFKIHHVKGKENGRADALSRRHDHQSNAKDPEPISMFAEAADGTLEHTPQVSEDWTVEDSVQVFMNSWTEYRVQWQQEDLQARRQDIKFAMCPNDGKPGPCKTCSDRNHHQCQDCSRGNHGPCTHHGNAWDMDDRVNGGLRPEDLLWFEGKPYIHDPNKRKDYIQRVHESKIGGHMGRAKTLAQAQQGYAFPGMKKLVEEVVDNCDICNKTKTRRHKPYGLLEPLPTPTAAWSSISMDFITGIPESKDPATGVSYDSIWVVVDRLTKWAYFLPCSKTTTAEQLAYLFERDIVSVHLWPDNIVSDRDKLFVSKFWQGLMQRMGVKSKLSTAFHPQTDGQTERLNQILETYLRAYVNFEQDNWLELLPTAQIAYNTTFVESTKISPFFALFGKEPELRRGPPTDAPRAAVRADRLQELHEHLKAELEFTRERMRTNYDNKRVEGPTLQEGDHVYLFARNLHTKRPSRKLDFKKLGPFRIVKKVASSNYELDLPTSMKVRTKVFHISLLEPAPEAAPLEEEIEAEADEEEFDVDEILDSQLRNGELHYLIRWLDYGPESDSWEPVDNLSCPEKIEEFHRKNPDRPTAQGATTESPDRQQTTPPNSRHYSEERQKLPQTNSARPAQEVPGPESTNPVRERRQSRQRGGRLMGARRDPRSRTQDPTLRLGSPA